MIESVDAVPILFLGPFELLIFALVLLVLAFGPQAQSMAKDAGKALGSLSQSKQEFDNEMSAVRDELDIDEDISEIKSEVGEIKQDVTGQPNDGSNTIAQSELNIQDEGNEQTDSSQE